MSDDLKELQRLGQEYDNAHIFKESPFYRKMLCALFGHKTYVISMRKVHAEERYLTGAMTDWHFRCQCGREYYQYSKT